MAGNPFEDEWVRAVVSLDERTATVHGFHDGNGVYRVRFRPEREGLRQAKVATRQHRRLSNPLGG